MPPSSSKSSKPKASEVAGEARKYYIPTIRRDYADQWPTYSYLHRQPLIDITGNRLYQVSSSYPTFSVYHGDPVDFALNWASEGGMRIPFICAANEKRPGGDWETAVVGYEERLCRRSNLSATLSTPGPGSHTVSNYPIPCEGAIHSDNVVVFRGPHDRYEKWETWAALPVISIPPTRWPKLTHGGAKYSFEQERDMAKNKIRAALTVCLYNNYPSVVVGDFGLGNGYRNPPVEMAELWREVLLYDPRLRGQFKHVAFVFEDPTQSTTRCIADDIAKKSKSSSGSSKSKSSRSGSSSSSSSAGTITDADIFRNIFSPAEIQRVRSRPDPRYGLGMITTPGSS